MHYYNGLSAAKRIGISYKTLLRYIERGKIVPEEGKTPTGQLVISEDQVEHLRLEVQRERDMFRTSQAVTSTNRQAETDVDSLPLTDTTLAETVKQLGKLQARCDMQQAYIEELERRVSEIERAQSQPATDSPSMSIPVSSSHASTTKTQPQKSIVGPSGDGILSARDFATKIGIEYTLLDGYIRRGIAGERMDVTLVPTSRKGYSNRYFTYEQQESAVELLRKHGKL